MSDILDAARDVEHALLSRGAHLRLVFGDLEEIKDGPRYASATCPFCGKRAKFRISHEAPVSSCWNAGCEWGDGWHNWYEYAETRGRTTSWVEFYRGLAAEAGVPWPAPDPQAQQRYQALRQRQRLLEATADILVETLSQPAGGPVRAYWHGRGYSDDDIAEMGLGAYPGQPALLEALKQRGFADREIRAADLIGPKWERHPALVVWRDRAGYPAGLMGRAIDPDVEPKYLYSKGLPRSQMLPGLERARKHEEIVLVESPLAALWLNARDLDRPVVALGGASLSRAQIEVLRQAGARRVILALDTDEAGERATLGVIKSLLAIQGIEHILVASWPPAVGKGLDDYAAARGVEAAQAAVNQAERVGAWLARRTADRMPEMPQALDEEAVLDDAVEQYVWLAQRDRLQGRDYVRSLAEALGWDEHLLWPRLEKAEARMRERESTEEAEALLAQALTSLDEGDASAAVETIELAQTVAREALGPTLLEPLDWPLVESDLLTGAEDLRSGWAALDDLVHFPRAGLSAVTGRSETETTAFLLNLVASWTSLYPERPIYYFSYSEPVSWTALRLVMLKAGVVREATGNLRAYIDYLGHHRGSDRAIEHAIEWYGAQVAAGGLVLNGDLPDLPAILESAAQLARQGPAVLVIDTLHHVAAGSGDGQGESGPRVARALRDAAMRRGIAIVVGEQHSWAKADDECSLLEREANLLLALRSGPGSGGLELAVEVVKSPPGLAAGHAYLSFDPRTGQVTDGGLPD